MTYDYWKSVWNDIATCENSFEMLGRSKMNFGELSLYLTDINSALKITLSDKILDAGCSSGLIAGLLAPFCKEITGADYSLPLIEKAKLFFASSNNLNFIHDSIEKVSLQGYNKLLAGAIFQYIPVVSSIDFLKRVTDSTIENAFICHIPSVSLKDSFIDGYKEFIKDEKALLEKQRIWNEQMTWYSQEDFKFLEQYFKVEFKEPNKSLVQHKYAFDLCLERL